MASFVFYDLTFLVLFTLAVVLFLYKRRSNLKRQGLMYLYRTKVGIKFIEWTSKKFGKVLKPMQYLVVACGYILMVSMIWLLIRFTYIYTKFDIARQIKIPPVLPLFPYATDLFKVDFLPPFYFTYWIVIIAIIAVSHEFAHGIFARLNRIRVHSTGFGFLGPFLAAFVEPDEKQMEKAKKFPQLSILAAGTFANILMTILFGLILWAFFTSSFVPAGVTFNVYPEAVVDMTAITMVSGVNIANLDEIPALVKEEGLTEIGVGDIEYLVQGEGLKLALEKDVQSITVFEDAPAVRADLKGPVIAINDREITSFDEFRNEIKRYNPGDEVKITSVDEENKGIKDYFLKLGEKDGEAYLGIGIVSPPRKGITGWAYSLVAKVKNPFIYYEPNWGGDFAWFIYNLLWWVVLINLSVALVNMLPVGIFDGGRFFYLSVWGITGNEKTGKKAFATATWLIIAVLIWLMIKWAFSVF